MRKIFLDKQISRRSFCRRCLYYALAAAAGPLFFGARGESAQVQTGPSSSRKNLIKKEALFYTKLDANRIQCQLCPRNCVLSDGMRGFCRVREPSGGVHYTLVYGNLTTMNPYDPIEKKPFFHFLPATTTFSIATAGCNFRCKYCQNWDISQSLPEEITNYYSVSPSEIISQAKANHCASIAYTYNDPAIFYEYMLDTAKLAKIQGIKNVVRTNGSLNPKPVELIAPYLDAVNVDLKGFTQEFYSEIPEGYLDTVLTTLKLLKKYNVWIEVTNLIVPTLNDNMADIKDMAVWISDNLGPDVPLHFSRFFPHYRLKHLPATPVSTLEKAYAIARGAGLNFVYIGNVAGHSTESTYCPRCKKPVIRRVGYTILEKNIDANGKSRCCSSSIPGVWS